MLSAFAIGALSGCSDSKPVSSPSDTSTANASSHQPAPSGKVPTDVVTLLSQSGISGAKLKPLGLPGSVTLWCFEVPAARAVDTWKKLRSKTKTSGFYPVVISQRLHDEWEELIVEHFVPLDEVLERASAINARHYLANRVQEYLHDPGEQPDFSTRAKLKNPDRFISLDDQADIGSTFILLLPTTDPWKVFAYVQYSGWNENPTAENHIAVTKYWHDLYGAEPVILTDSVIEMITSKPPSNRAQAESLAMEHFAYTGGDIIYQGVEDFGVLASMLEHHRCWYFWWD